MRKFILITAMVLASATAQAGPMRGLTLASNDQPAEQAKPVEQKPAETAESGGSSGRQRSADLCRAARGRRYRDRSAEGERDAVAEKADQDDTALRSRSAGANRPKRA